MRRLLGIAAIIFVLASTGLAASAPEEVLDYVRAIRVQRLSAYYSADVTISASVPSLHKTGVLHAIKKLLPQGLRYESMLFEGDKLVKTNVIARYLAAELEDQRPEEHLATEISPLNYRFSPKGSGVVNGREAFVYEVKPLKKRTGLFRGTVWVDRQTYLPLKEEGKLKNLPSVWVKEIAFTRDYQIVNGFAVPVRISSEVKTRVIGKALVTVEFSDYRFQDPPPLEAASTLSDPTQTPVSLPTN